MLKGFNREDLVDLWNLVKEKFSSTVPSVDKEKALWVELKRLFEPDADDVLWKLQRHDMFMLTDKDYPLSNAVMTLMLSAKLQVKEDNEMARDLVMKIFIEANKPKSKNHKPRKYMSKTLRPDAPIIEDWISDSEDETEIESVPKQKEPSFVPTSEHVKTPRESVKKVEHPKQVEHLRTNNHTSRGHKKN
nr:hypothetical protein [Tanacetum cinerariifolium]